MLVVSMFERLDLFERQRMQIVCVDSSLCLSRGQLWNVDKVSMARINYIILNYIILTFMFSPLSGHGVKPYFHRAYPRRGGNSREYVMYL